LINSAKDYPISQIFDIETKVVYQIPRYQREYSWSRPQWENLIDDIMENAPGYYLGSIICINPTTDSLEVQKLELVDGQQRLLTISLLFAALYAHLAAKNLDGDMQAEKINIRRKLILKGTDDQLRIIPQIQNKNQEDYIGLLSNLKLYPNNPAPAYAGNRRIFRAYQFFADRLEKMNMENGDSIAVLMDLLGKINIATLVKIEVSNHADAYTLFESLNTRGMPLTAVDLIKNKLLARMETSAPGRINYAFNQWTLLLDYLGDNYATQERFFRQYYNAYREDLKNIYSVPIATKSNIMKVYEKLIDVDSENFIKRIVEAGRVYSILLDPDKDYIPSKLVRALTDLDRIQGTPSYLLMMYLLGKQTELDLTDEHLVSITNTLVRFFVRRNLTDTPPTRDLTPLFIEIIANKETRTGAALKEYIESKLVSKSATDEAFHSKLTGAIYRENSGVARFILCDLAEHSMTTETMTDLWAKAGNNFTWTVEHVLPQGENIPKDWVNMIGNGDFEIAKAIQEECVHSIGNLTITGFNSTLSNKSFEEKRDRIDRQGHYVGYRNGLSLNRDLLDVDTWDKEKIEQRTEKLVAQILELYKMQQ